MSTLCFSQSVDTIITTPIYTSYYSYKTHTPLFVVYKLYKGGGVCSRKGMNFESDKVLQTSTYDDYNHSGYDIGHLCNAEDFAFDCDKEKSTFKFYNTIPQRPNLNRGIWSKYESSIRKLSQTDSLLIICGGYNFIGKIGKTMIPTICFKIVRNLNTKDTKYYIFNNDDSKTVKELPLGRFLSIINYQYINSLLIH